MADEQERPDTPLLDEWIAEVGEAEVAATVRNTIRAIEDGLLPGHTDADALLQYWNSRRRRSA
jgi:hypothetical protein